MLKWWFSFCLSIPHEIIWAKTQLRWQGVATPRSGLGALLLSTLGTERPGVHGLRIPLLLQKHSVTQTDWMLQQPGLKKSEPHRCSLCNRLFLWSLIGSSPPTQETFSLITANVKIKMASFLSVESKWEFSFSLILCKAHNFFTETLKKISFGLSETFDDFVCSYQRCMISNNYVQDST